MLFRAEGNSKNVHAGLSLQLRSGLQWRSLVERGKQYCQCLGMLRFSDVLEDPRANMDDALCWLGMEAVMRTLASTTTMFMARAKGAHA